MRKIKNQKLLMLILALGLIITNFESLSLEVHAQNIEKIQNTQEMDGNSNKEEIQDNDSGNLKEDIDKTKGSEFVYERKDDNDQKQDETKELQVEITSSKTSREYVDRSVILTTNVQNAEGMIQYQYVEEYNGKTNVIQEYSEESTYTFRSIGIGTHIYYVNVKDENGNTASAEYEMEVVAHPSQIISGKILSNKTSNEYVDRYVTLTVQSTGGYGTLQYEFVEEYNGREYVLQEYSIDKSYTFVTSNPGEHTYYVRIKDDEGQKIEVSYIMNVVIHPQKVLSGTVICNKSNREYVERSIVLTGKAIGGYGKLQYRFSEIYNNTENILQDFSEKSDCSFVTSQMGTHIYYIDIKDNEGQNVRCSYTITVVAHPEKVLDTQLKSNKSSREYIGRYVTLTGKTTGGYGKLQYRFSEAYGATVTIKQEYSSRNTYSFSTSGPGHHIFYIDVMDEQGQVIRKSYSMDVVVHSDYVIKGIITSSKSSREYIQRNIVLTGQVTGGYGELVYQFSELYDGKEKIVRNYSSDNTYSFSTTGPGTHIYYIYVKDKANQIVRLSYELTVVVHPNYTLKSVVESNKTAREYVKRSIVLCAKTVGGYGENQYKFTEVYGASMNVKKEYSDSNTYAFTTTGVGTHIFYVDVKDREGQIVRSSYKMEVTPHPDYRLNGNFTSNVNGKAKPGQKIQLNVSSTGGYGNTHRYRFRENYGGKTKVIANYSTKKTCDFTFLGNGTHLYYVDILDSESQILTLSLKITSPDYATRMAVFSTVSTNNANGTYNMTRALLSFNQVVLQPGETLSFFGVAGPCGKAQGYKEAGVVGGTGYGGGICQASTTLYGAALRAGMTIVQRRNHSVPSTYVPIGQDAMVDYGSSDLKFRNDFDFPVKIVTYVSGKTLYAEIWGLQPTWYDYINVSSWSTGSKSAAACRYYMKNGSVVKTEQLPSSYYR